MFASWSDCRYRSFYTCDTDADCGGVWGACEIGAHSCRNGSNDIVLSSSSDGVSWTPQPQRVPIDATTSGADHFLPGLDVEPGTSGAAAHLALAYYFYPSTNCDDVGESALSPGLLFTLRLPIPTIPALSVAPAPGVRHSLAQWRAGELAKAADLPKNDSAPAASGSHERNDLIHRAVTRPRWSYQFLC